ncbi:hypothetical protein P9112_010965 [Eukaryota sp. TZLM1-RC]
MARRTFTRLSPSKKPRSTSPPNSSISAIYSQCSITVSLRDGSKISSTNPLKLSDLQQCLLYLLNPLNFKPPFKFNFANIPLLKSAVLVHIQPHLPCPSSLSALNSCSSLFAGSWLSTPLPFRHSCRSSLKRFLTYSSATPTASSPTSSSSSSSTLEQLLMDRTDLESNNYPLSGHVGSSTNQLTKSPCPTYVDTESHTAEHPEPIVAIDCEMVKCGFYTELARASVVNFDGEIIIDLLVKPSLPITDYVTSYSGITPEILEGVTRTAQEARDEILKYIDGNTIIVGHSLENDLHSLGLIHHKVIDTSILFPHPYPNSDKGFIRKYSLKMLANQHLDATIQTNSSGHDSVEDSVAALNLVKLKLEKGLDYGKIVLQHSSLVDMFGDKKSLVFGGENENFGDKCHLISSQNDLDTVTKFGEVVEDFDFIAFELNNLDELNNNLFIVLTSLRNNSVVFVVSGSGDGNSFFFCGAKK